MLYNVSMAASTPSSFETSYIRIVDSTYSCDATFLDFNDMLDKLMIKYNKKSIKQEVLEMYGECIYFTEEENNNLKNYIHLNSVEEKNNIFDYYD